MVKHCGLGCVSGKLIGLGLGQSNNKNTNKADLNCGIVDDCCIGRAAHHGGVFLCAGALVRVDGGARHIAYIAAYAMHRDQVFVRACVHGLFPIQCARHRALHSGFLTQIASLGRSVVGFVGQNV